MLKQVDFRDGFAICRGEVTRYRGPVALKEGGVGFSTAHNGVKRFRIDMVTVSEIEKDKEWCERAFNQGVENCGYNCRRTRGGNVTMLPTTPEQRVKNITRARDRKILARKLERVTSSDGALDLATEAEEKGLGCLVARAMDVAAELQ